MNRAPGWVLLPLRLFLAVTFVYAGVQKLTDPHFFHRGTPDYIGNQLIGFAHGSPLHDIVMRYAVPHAVFFGLLIAFGEIAIGLGALVGFLFRPAAFFGMLLSTIFFLTASWHVYPYFYGSDIVFTFCWLTLLLCGPLGTGLPSLDALLVPPLLVSVPAGGRAVFTSLTSFFLGVPRTPKQGEMEIGAAQALPSAYPRGMHQQRLNYTQRARETRRTFLLGALSGGAGVLVLTAMGFALRLVGVGNSDQGTQTTAPSSSSNGSNPANALSATPPASSNTPQPGSTATAGAGTGGTTLAQASAVPKNSAVTFTIPSSGDPGVLIHLPNDRFVAYDATCTHAGCQVAYDPQSGDLQCPCHGAVFDPAQGAAVLQGPASSPLAAVNIRVDSTGAIILQPGQ